MLVHFINIDIDSPILVPVYSRHHRSRHLDFGERGEQTKVKSNGSKVFLAHKLLFPGKVLEEG